MKICSVCKRCYDDAVVSCSEDGLSSLDLRDGSPEMFAGYTIETWLGSGMNSDAFHARHDASGRSCIIKTLKASDNRSEHFMREAKLAACSFCPGMTDVYETGELETGTSFIVAEDAPGETIQQSLADGVPSLLTAIRVMRMAAEATHHIHSNGLIHRAICPANIIIATDSDGDLLVRLQGIDLGGAIEHSIVSNKLLIDSSLDSIRYFAPEQFSGEGSGLQTDVYSLGIVFYEMLAGVPPFDAAHASGLIEQHRHQKPPEIKIENFDLRMLITHSLSEALQKQPSLRQATAGAFARQLRHIEQLATHVSTPPPALIVPSVRSNGDHAAAAAKMAPIEVPVPRSDEVEASRAVHQPARPETPNLQTDPIPVSYAAKAVEPQIVHWDQPEDDVPSMDDVLEVLQRDQIDPPAVRTPEVEEVTLVRPNQEPHRISLDEADIVNYLPETDPPNRRFVENEFVPTILGTKHGVSKTARKTENGPRSSFRFGSVFPGRFPKRAAVVTCAAAAILLFYGNAIVQRSRQVAENSGQGSPAVTPVQQPGLSEVKKEALNPGSTVTALTNESLPDEMVRDVNNDRIKPLTIAAREPSAVPERTAVSKPAARRSATENKAAEKAVFVPSTIVISPENGRVRARIEPNRVVSEKLRTSTPVRSDGITRPRIVKDPKP